MYSMLHEAFKELSLLKEADFNLNDEIDTFDLSQLDDEIPTMDIIDTEAETEDDVEDSYEGKLILDCNVCHTKIYKDPSEVVLDENGEVANIDDECPVCFSCDGYTVIGKVETLTDEEVEEVIENAEDEEEVEETEDDMPLFNDEPSFEVEVDDDFIPDDDVDESLFEAFLTEADGTYYDEQGNKVGMGNQQKAGVQVNYAGQQKTPDELKADQAAYIKARQADNAAKQASAPTNNINDDTSGDNSQYLKNQQAQVKYDQAKADMQNAQANNANTGYDPDTNINGVKKDAPAPVESQPQQNQAETAPAPVESQPQNNAAETAPAPVQAEPQQSAPEGPGAGSPNYDDGQTRVIGFDQTNDGTFGKTVAKSSPNTAGETTDESLNEDFESATISTDSEIISMTTTDDGGVTVSTQPIAEEIVDEIPEVEDDVHDVVAPLEDSDIDAIENPVEEVPEEEVPVEEVPVEEVPETEMVPEEEEEDIPVESFNRKKFSRIHEAYLTSKYSNVTGYNATSCEVDGNKIYVEGIIKFKNGNLHESRLVLEAHKTNGKKLTFLGESLNTKNKFVVEGFASRASKMVTPIKIYEAKAELSDSKGTVAYELTHNEAVKNEFDAIMQDAAVDWRKSRKQAIELVDRMNISDANKTHAKKCFNNVKSASGWYSTLGTFLTGKTVK